MRKTLAALAFLSMTLLAACGAAQTALTPTPVDISAVQTAAVKTVVAGSIQTAEAMPTTTLEPTLPPTETLAPTPTETSVPAGSPTPSTCDNAAWVADVSVPDGTQMTAGQEFVKTWKVKNTGTCTWKAGYQIILSYGDRLNGQSTALTAEVAPEAEIEISVNLRAPDKSGTYNGYWILRNNNGFNFGQRLSVVIVVP